MIHVKKQSNKTTCTFLCAWKQRVTLCVELINIMKKLAAPQFLDELSSTLRINDFPELLAYLLVIQWKLWLSTICIYKIRKCRTVYPILCFALFSSLIFLMGRFHQALFLGAPENAPQIPNNLHSHSVVVMVAVETEQYKTLFLWVSSERKWLNNAAG